MEDNYIDDLSDNEPCQSCPECGKSLIDIEYDMQFCENCGWEEEIND